MNLSEEQMKTRALDPFYQQARAIVIDRQRASISLIQREMRIGYNHAARLLEAMEGDVVSPAGADGIRQMLCQKAEPQPTNSQPQMKFQVQELRPEVLAFALMMEAELRKKDAERGGDSWKIMPPGDLLISATAQMLHAEKAITNGEEYIKHIVHAANYCMMAADVSGGLTCGKHNDGHPCTMPADISCPDCGRSAIDYAGE